MKFLSLGSEEVQLKTFGLNSVDIVCIVARAAVHFVEFNLTVLLPWVAKLNGLVDLDRLWKLAVGLQVPRLIRRVLENHVSLRVLIVPQADQDNV